MSDALTPGATARLLGVAPATLRSWDRRYGIGPRERSPGGHRRYSSADIARLIELCRLVGEGLPPRSAADQVLSLSSTPGPRPAARARPGGDTLPLGRAEPAVQGLARAAMRVDTDLLESLLESALRENGVVPTWERLAMPVLYGVGSKWEETGRYVEVEHLLSWSVSSALRRVPEPDGGSERLRPVVLACMPQEMHSLPVEALAAALREAGLPRRVLGPCTPMQATVQTVRRIGPRAVVLWSHTGSAMDTTVLGAIARETARTPARTALYTAGPGWRLVSGAPRSATVHLTSLTDAVRALTG